MELEKLSSNQLDKYIIRLRLEYRFAKSDKKAKSKYEELTRVREFRRKKRNNRG
jgi:hypothetical protein